MSEWQPIETAPRDGTDIIILVDNMAIQGYFHTPKDIPVHATWIRRDGRWEYITLESHGCGCCSSYDPPPTHWMPLPEPPK